MGDYSTSEVPAIAGRLAAKLWKAIRKHSLVSLVIFIILLLPWVLNNKPAVKATDGNTQPYFTKSSPVDHDAHNEKISNCLKNKDCIFMPFGEFTTNPRLSFLILEKLWLKFSDKDKSDARNILKEKIKEANDGKEIRSIQSYSILLSRGKTKDGDLLIDKEIMMNF
ncbi:MAG: hypothetical protein EPN22_16835 [Nitrospirae bacterium]|nr:MAG: hypothetical protein EPN22_16835 [Nitrospirota bacterium]